MTMPAQRLKFAGATANAQSARVSAAVRDHNSAAIARSVVNDAIDAYVTHAVAKAQIVFDAEDGCYYGEIPDVVGVYAAGASAAACQTELRSALQDWVLFRLAEGYSLPRVAPIE